MEVKSSKCLACLEPTDVNQLCHLDSCNISHYFCPTCMSLYFKGKIVSGCTEIKCPIIYCNAIASEKDILSFVDSLTATKYKRFKAMKVNPNYRECGSCGSELTYSELLDVTCTCGAVTCSKHSLSHPGRICTEFDSLIAKADQFNAKAIKKISKKCPQCSVNTEQIGGCKYMVCSRCSCYWCWNCQQAGLYNHFEHHCFRVPTRNGDCIIL